MFDERGYPFCYLVKLGFKYPDIARLHCERVALSKRKDTILHKMESGKESKLEIILEENECKLIISIEKDTDNRLIIKAETLFN